MRVDIAFIPQEVSYYDVGNYTAVVIDVFRFTTSALAALEAGAESITAVKEPQEAFDMRSQEKDLILAGERHALRIPGFDFGNSPLELQNESIRGKRVVFCTTNGTSAVQSVSQAKEVILASVRSISAVARYLKEQGRDILLVPAGLRGRFSLEDTWCAGQIINHLPDAELSDGAAAAKLLAQGVALDELLATEHGRRLERLALSEDLDYCLQINKSNNTIVFDPVSGWGRLA